jgi:1-acyl-sn-glycerol-3-phosphate acyltransferase
MDDWKLQPARDLGLPLQDRARSLRREEGLGEALLHRAWWMLIGGYLRSYHRLRIVGREHLPQQPPFVLVANHGSHLDALALAAMLPARLRHCVFPIAAGETFFQTPAMAAFAAFVLNALPMWRRNCGAHALQELRARILEEPCGYILFPEGTRTRDGSMNSFKAGIGMLVAGTKVPIVPCHLTGCHEAWPPGAHFPLPRKISIRIGDPVSFGSIADDRAGWHSVAGELEQRVRALAIE